MFLTCFKVKPLQSFIFRNNNTVIFKVQKRFHFVLRRRCTHFCRNGETYFKCYSQEQQSKFHPLSHCFFSTSSQLLETEKIKREEFDISEKQVKIHTCKELYKTWKKQKKFRKVPEGGLIFTVKYIDTATSDSKQSKHTVLLLHGAPGHYKDFQRNITYLNEHGIRIIAPNFPDFSIYKPGVFRFSPEEKAEYVRDFLKSINVSKIDALISHSSSIYPSLLLCTEKKFPVINSLILLNPGTHKAIRNFIYAKMLVQLSESSIGIKILNVFGSFLLTAFKTPVNFDNVLDPLLSATTMVHAEFWKTADHLKKLCKEKFPLLFVFSGNDKLISKRRNYAMAKLLGISEKEVWCYDSAGQLKRRGDDYEWLKVIEFEAGSHYVFWKHSEVVNKTILEHLEKLPLT